MPVFKVDVKAFLMVTVEADTIEGAIEEARDFVEGLSPNPDYAEGWNSARAKDEAYAGRKVVGFGGCFDTEDTEYVEDEDGEEIER